MFPWMIPLLMGGAGLASLFTPAAPAAAAAIPAAAGAAGAAAAPAAGGLGIGSLLSSMNSPMGWALGLGGLSLADSVLNHQDIRDSTKPTKEDKKNTREKVLDRMYVDPGEGYNPGFSAEHNFFPGDPFRRRNAYASGGSVGKDQSFMDWLFDYNDHTKKELGDHSYRKYAEGGLVPLAKHKAVQSGADKELIADAITYLTGENPDDDIARRFMARFGRDAFVDLAHRVKSELGSEHTPDESGQDQGRMILGPGTGTSDSIPAVISDTGEPAKLSNGEYVIPKHAVDRIGVGNIHNMVQSVS